MRRAFIVLWLLTWSFAARADFHDVVQVVQRSSGIKRTRIPFLGLARFFVNIVEPEGISDFRLAVFEGASRRLPEDFDRKLRDAIGPQWQPVVTATSKRDGERSLIFARESGHRMRMLIVALEDNEAAVVELELDPERFADFIQRAQNGDPVFDW